MQSLSRFLSLYLAIDDLQASDDPWIVCVYEPRHIETAVSMPAFAPAAFLFWTRRRRVAGDDDEK